MRTHVGAETLLFTVDDKKDIEHDWSAPPRCTPTCPRHTAHKPRYSVSTKDDVRLITALLPSYTRKTTPIALLPSTMPTLASPTPSPLTTPCNSTCPMRFHHLPLPPDVRFASNGMKLDDTVLRWGCCWSKASVRTPPARATFCRS